MGLITDILVLEAINKIDQPKNDDPWWTPFIGVLLIVIGAIGIGWFFSIQ